MFPVAGEIVRLVVPLRLVALVLVVQTPDDKSVVCNKVQLPAAVQDTVTASFVCVTFSAGGAGLMKAL